MPANEDEQLEPSHHHSLSDSEKLHSHTVLHPLIAQWALSLQNNTKPKRRVIENFFHKTWHKFLSNDKMLFLKYFRNDGIRKELLHSGKKLLKKRILKFFCFCTIFQFLAYHCVILLTMEWMMLWIFHVVPSPNILSISSFSNRDSNVTAPPIKTFWRENSSHLTNWHFWDRLKKTRFCNTVLALSGNACSYFFHLNEFFFLISNKYS